MLRIFYYFYSDALFCLSLCHTIITEEKGPNDLIYNASSPDELALVNFAKYVGFYYFGTDNDQNMLVKFNNQTHKFKLLQTLEFNSTRCLPPNNFFKH